MNRPSLAQLISEYFENIPRPYVAFDFGKNISYKKLKNAKRIYAAYNSDEEPLLLIDGTFFGSAKRGLLLTNQYLYYRLKVDKSSWEVSQGKIPLGDIRSLYIQVFRGWSNLLINGKQIACLTVFSTMGVQKKEAEIMNDLFKRMIDAVHTDLG